MFSRRKKIKGQPFDMDEVLLDATNLPHFDTQQFEGRLEKPIRPGVIFSVFILFSIAMGGFLFRSWDLQIAEGQKWQEHSEYNRLDNTLIFAKRGSVYDRNGAPLAWNITDTATNTPYLLRRYKEGVGLGHILGYVRYPKADTSGNYYQTTYEGVGGVESLYGELLGGENGTQIIEENALGTIVSEAIINTPKEGIDLHLSIDAEVQSKLYTTIQELADRVGFKGGAGAILDVTNGELLALASYPDIDSQILTDGNNGEAISTFLTSKRKYFLNRAVSGLYTPGSIVKPFMGLAALEENIISPEKEIYSAGYISIPNPYDPTRETVFKDWKAHGWVDLRDALAVSSDVYFYAIGGGYEDQVGLGIRRIDEYMKLFGLAEKTGIDVIAEAVGTIPTPEWKEEVFGEDWLLGNTYHTSIGQYGFQVTPIQMVRAIAALANGGMLVTPHITIQDKHTATELIPGISDDHLEIIREGMREAVTRGTAQGLSTPTVRVAGKTGTAELGVKKDRVNSWVTGFFPYEEPRYAFVVVMEDGPVKNLIGGTYVMRQMLDWMAQNTPEYLR